MPNLIATPGSIKGFWPRQTGTTPFDARTLFPQAQGSASAYSADILYAGHFYSGRGGLIDRIGLKVTVAGAGGKKARVGIYNITSESNLYPNALLLDSGELAVDAVAVVEAVVSFVIPADQFLWVAYLTNGTPTVQGGACRPVMFWDSNYTEVLRLQVSQAYGALPATFPAAATMSAGNSPAVGVRYV